MRLNGFGIRAAVFSVGLLGLSPMLATETLAARTPAAAARPAVKTVSAKALKLPVMRVAFSAGSAHSTTLIIGGHRITATPSTRRGMGSFRLGLLRGGKGRYYGSTGGYGGLQCVPFAREASGIALKGNAANWWDAANGVYARGAAPEAGSVLNFRATGHMQLGHVAVVARVLGSREIEIDHANWAGPGAGRGGVSRSIPVVDVSEANDWSAVRVGLGRSGNFGSVYPTYGFIYDRPDNGSMATNRRVVRYDEVAEAPLPR